MRLVIIGPPGTGKGTQAKLLAKKYKLKAVSAGEILREEVKSGTRLGRKISMVINKGDFIPDRITIKIMKKKLKNHPRIIIDGFPRDKNQARKLKTKIDYVILLKTGRQNILKRLLKRKRKDDTLKTIRHRIALYNKKTKPLIAYFKKKKIPIMTINGDHTINHVHKEIERKLNARIQVH